MRVWVILVPYRNALLSQRGIQLRRIRLLNGADFGNTAQKKHRITIGKESNRLWGETLETGANEKKINKKNRIRVLAP